MAKYAPTTHTISRSATIDGTTIHGLGPGEAHTVISDSRTAGVVWLPTKRDADGFPDGLQPFTISQIGTVS